jgi:hypothetical protein
MSISPASASSRGGRITGMRTAAHRSERPHHGRHARPDFLETPAMGAQSIFSVSAKHVYWTVRQLGRPAAGYLQASVRFRTVQTTFSLVKVSLWT